MILIGEKIKNIRELRNYTQLYMAAQMEITQAGYSKIERGESDISLSKLYRISKILDVRIEDIFLFDLDKSLNNSNTSHSNIVFTLSMNEKVEKLYLDKIAILEKLLQKTEQELSIYIGKYGYISGQ